MTQRPSTQQRLSLSKTPLSQTDSNGHTNERNFPYSHGTIGTNPFGGHHNWMLNQAHRAGVRLK